MIIALLGDARAAGAEAQCAQSPKERLRVSLQDFYRAKKSTKNSKKHYLPAFSFRRECPAQ
jgi:hypothetical protein